MKRILLLFIMIACSLSAIAQGVYYDQSPKIPSSTSNARMPDIIGRWIPVDISSISIPSVFGTVSLIDGELVPQSTLTLGIAKTIGAADARITVEENGDTTIEVKGIVYWGYGIVGGITDIFGDGDANPNFITVIVGGVENYALCVGVNWISKSFEKKIQPSFVFGATANIFELPFLKRTARIKFKS